MATNATLIYKMRLIVEMDNIQTKLRATGGSVSDSGMHHDIMVSASHLDDIMVTMCSDLRRLCQEPYGDQE